MKKNVYKFIILILAIGLLGGIMMSCKSTEKTIDYEACSNYIPNEDNKGKVILNGKIEITNDVEVFYEKDYDLDYAMLPVFELLQCLGCELKWENDYLLKINLEGREYTLDISEQALFDSKGNVSYINDIGGGPVYVYIKPKKIILNDMAITGLLFMIEKPCYFNIDVENKVVDVIVR